MPPTSVYFVCPLCIARSAASLMRAGVSKSGSPAPNEITSIPCDRSSLALAWTASVDDGASVFRRSASTTLSSWEVRGRASTRLLQGELLGETLLHGRRDHAVDRRAEARHFLDEPRG